MHSPIESCVDSEILSAFRCSLSIDSEIHIFPVSGLNDIRWRSNGEPIIFLVDCDAHLAESLFQTYSKLKSEVLLLQNTLLYYVQTIFCFFVRKILLFRISAFLNIQFCISCMLVNKCLSWRHVASHQDLCHAGSHTGILDFHPLHSPGFRI